MSSTMLPKSYAYVGPHDNAAAGSDTNLSTGTSLAASATEAADLSSL